MNREKIAHCSRPAVLSAPARVLAGMTAAGESRWMADGSGGCSADAGTGDRGWNAIPRMLFWRSSLVFGLVGCLH
jgi:hypothetical protein